ncbi:MAG: homocitrate synthase family protein [Actinobacteria bacterium]|nr:homocitrate synthase family protein [Actinomycetota bacterium]MCG2789016.1 homocitrate synthase family protein [Actinomycetes bacterium]
MITKINDKSYVNIIDTTLRNGEQTAGVVFSKHEKIRIAKLLDEVGIPEIEIGTPSLGPAEREIIQEIIASKPNCKLFTYCEADPANIAYAAECGVKNIIINISTSDLHLKVKYGKTRTWALNQLRKTISEAKSNGLDFIVSAEDATRTDLEFLLKMINIAQKKGAYRFRICDTVSRLDPFRTFLYINTILNTIDFPIEVYNHNDFGMATANAMAAIRAGASSLVTSVNGLGEGTGNAALEEIVMALKYLEEVDLGMATSKFRELSEYVAKASARAIPVWKAIVGTNVFAHESGIHADGVLKNPINYEVFEPGEVGLTRQIVVGKHSGSHTILHKFKEFEIDLTDKEATDILAMTRLMSVDLKRPLFDKELMYIYKDYRENKQVEV